MQIQKFTTTLGGRELTIEVGRLAKLANASCTVSYGGTMVLATAVMSKKARDDMDYFPLLVDYRENMYAAGKISGSKWVKREGRPSEEATLTSRMIDRALRPLFDQRIRNDVQIVTSVISHDKKNNADIPALIAASVVLSISEIPWAGPIAGVTIGKINGELVINPQLEQKDDSEFIIQVVGKSNEVVMLEAGLKEVAEDEVAAAIAFGIQTYQPILEFINKMVAEIKPVKIDLFPNQEESEQMKEVATVVKAECLAVYSKVNGEKDKATRQDALDELEGSLLEKLVKSEDPEAPKIKQFIVTQIEKEIGELFRESILKHEKRIDGRALDEIRNLSASVGLIPRTHGSGLFERGETQVLSSVTLAGPGLEQIVETMETETKKRYMHHYNFPGFCVGEVRPFRGVGRREIGHGALAEKALIPVLPNRDDFPYTIRVVSEVLGSNGSSSQASICGSTLSLMDAGVPIKRPVAGLAMGLVMTPDMKDYKILTDIQGIEDHEGDMDFKVAGTTAGTTAIQLDIKLGGVSMEIIKDTLEAAKKARLQILKVMTETIVEPRKELSEFAPRIETIKIDPEKIGEVIGPGGKVINQIIDETGVTIDIEEDGTVFICSETPDGMKQAVASVKSIVREAQVGEIYEGKVVKIVTDRNSGAEIGAIVELWENGKDGMVHISQFKHERINKVSDLVKLGGTLKVKVMGIDKEKDRIELSHKALIPAASDFKVEPRVDTEKRKPFFKKRD